MDVVQERSRCTTYRFEWLFTHLSINQGGLEFQFMGDIKVTMTVRIKGAHTGRQERKGLKRLRSNFDSGYRKLQPMGPRYVTEGTATCCFGAVETSKFIGGGGGLGALGFGTTTSMISDSFFGHWASAGVWPLDFGNWWMGYLFGNG